MGCRLSKRHWGRSFIYGFERWPFWCLFAGVFLTGFGSGWYHLAPYNDSLVWNRLPMAIAFMSIFSTLIAERVYPRLGVVLLGPLVTLGIASVLWWIWTEHQGQGDLRWYLLVQFFPVLAMPPMLLLLPTPYTRHGLLAAARVLRHGEGGRGLGSPSLRIDPRTDEWAHAEASNGGAGGWRG